MHMASPTIRKPYGCHSKSVSNLLVRAAHLGTTELINRGATAGTEGALIAWSVYGLWATSAANGPFARVAVQARTDTVLRTHRQPNRGLASATPRGVGTPENRHARGTPDGVPSQHLPTGGHVAPFTSGQVAEGVSVVHQPVIRDGWNDTVEMTNGPLKQRACTQAEDKKSLPSAVAAARLGKCWFGDCLEHPVGVQDAAKTVPLAAGPVTPKNRCAGMLKVVGAVCAGLCIETGVGA